MKKRIYFCLFIIFVTASVTYGQKAMKDLILNKDLKIEKLVIKNEDITLSLGSVNITEDIWMEYDRSGKEIGKANIQEFTNDHIKIKWIFADNGAEVGAVTIYKYYKDENEDKMIFNILFDDKEQGHFEAKL